jgi:ferredoxin
VRLLNAVDAAFNRLYGWRGNPLYQSGTIAVVLLLVLIVTGLWLIFFYRVGAPYESVARIDADVWIGRWARALHRYASDAAVVAILVHAFRMFAQGRSWGPRALAWSSGVILFMLVFVVGLTGYVMVWDTFGMRIAQEGARMIDSLPILSEPIGRAFTGETDLLGPFFFLNLFAHIAIPLGIALVLWLHVSKVARPVLLPPKTLAIAIVAMLTLAAIVFPPGLQPKASAFLLPGSIEMDLLFGFWLPLIARVPAGVALVGLLSVMLLALFVPLFVRRRAAAVPPPSVVDEDVCVGCTQCALDCPYDAITMITRAPGGRSELVARVTPDLCVSCGICAGSCAPMSVGPPGRTGRDQLSRVREFIDQQQIRNGRHVVICCERGSRALGAALAAENAAIYTVDCSGSLHTSVIELLVRAGAPGVLVLSCPPRDCWNREGPNWLVERMYNEREAELQARVDRKRIRVEHVGANEAGRAAMILREFIAATTVKVAVSDTFEDPDTTCTIVESGANA